MVRWKLCRPRSESAFAGSFPVSRITILCTICQEIHNFVKGIVNPIALRKAKIVCNFGLSWCSSVKMSQVRSVCHGPYH